MSFVSYESEYITPDQSLLISNTLKALYCGCFIYQDRKLEYSELLFPPLYNLSG